MKEKLWTKDYLSITTLSFFIFLAFYVLLTALPLYLVGTLHAGADKVGLLVTLFLGAAIIIRPFAGRWVSNGAQKQILVYSAVAFFIGTLLYPFVAKNIWALLLLRVFHGMTFGVITTAKGTICAELIPASRRGEGLSYFSLAMSLAMVFGPFIGLKFAAINAYNSAFITCMVISVVTIVLAVIIKVPDTDDATKTLSEKSKFSWNDLFDKKAAPFALATFILACAYSGISAFLALYMKGLGLASLASSFFLIYAGLIMISRPFTGRWSDRLGSKIIVYPCFVIFAIGMFLLSQSHASYLFLIAGALIGIGYGSVTPILQTQTISSVEPHRVGIANSLFFNSMDAGMAIGAYALGIMASGSGYRSIYVAGVVLIIVTGLQYLVLTHKKEILEIQAELTSELVGK
ncbi:arabinose efflux permease family protein [Desulfosporosinus acidiphilus SJ4]|uniref:Arabinose efflux permease family protein n=1 Tax=Desulfosporosinus acidiphilus (strain DSM 22704 / JCM 16185 / SJ4) TaxID=646529 RepID=I4D5M1_DESAJ|nr:MFS transporter [Desulfosporosinus acidiphilus]AFM41095.1 arabinose efflux permease family protein [Desulfosporosinus acidiphilus SJ4]